LRFDNAFAIFNARFIPIINVNKITDVYIYVINVTNVYYICVIHCGTLEATICNGPLYVETINKEAITAVTALSQLTIYSTVMP